VKKFILEKLDLVTRTEYLGVFVEKIHLEQSLLEAIQKNRELEQRISALEVLMRPRKLTFRQRVFSKWAVVITAFWLLAIGLFIGVIVPKADKPTLEPDYAACISQATYNNPIPENKYQELVNALYTCNVFKVES